MSDERKHRLLLTFELPSFYAEDMTREALADWMETTGQSYEQALMEDVRTSSVVLIVLESEGEKDSDVVVVPGLLARVEVEDAPPSDEPDSSHYWKLARDGWRTLQAMDDDDAARGDA